MKTPAGRECKFYYQDFHRGRAIQECRLERDNPNSLPWHPSDCSRCPVPDILNANASPDLALTLTISRGLLGLTRRSVVTAQCSRHRIPVSDPFVGCPRCAEERGGLNLFKQALDELGEQDDQP